MDTERSGLDEAMDVGSSTVSHLKSLKTAATFSKAGYGAALGGPFTAAIGAVIANRNQLAKILLVILAILLLPVLFIVMLPGLIFGSLTEQSDVLNSNSMISENIRASREAIVEVLEESHEDILAEIHAAISRLPQGDTASINDPYTYSISVNANLLKQEILEMRDKGATIIFSTHNMGSVEELCDEISLINRSHVVLQGEINNIREQHKKHLFKIEVQQGNLQSNDLYEILETKERYANFTYTLRKRNAQMSNNELISLLTQQCQLSGFEEILPTMNEIFIETVGESALKENTNIK